jgi:hypothetical protein
MAIVKILKLVGLYKVNEEYLKPVNDKLEGIETDFNAVAKVSDYSSQVIDALNSGDKTKAVNVALEFCKVDDEVKELKEIQRKIEEEETIDAAVAAANGPELIKEIAASTMKEVTDHYKKVTELLPNIVALSEEISERLKNVKSAADNWSLAEKLGTPEAMRNTAEKVKKIQNSAKEAKTKMEVLKKSIEEIEI